MLAHFVYIYMRVLAMQKSYIYFVLIIANKLDIKDQITSKTLFPFCIRSESLDCRYFCNFMTFSIFLTNIILFKISAIDPTKV